MSAAEFIQAFTKIEGVLRKLIRVDNGTPFRTVLRSAAEKHSLVRAHEYELAKFAELRNAIVHEPTKSGRTIAEPHPDVVLRIQQIAAQLTDPPKVMSIAVQQVKTIDVCDPISLPLRWSQELRISQFPVYSETQFQGLLGARCIAQWLADSVANAGILFDEVSVGVVMEHDETRGQSVAFLSRDASVYDAIELFAQPPQPNRPVLEAILITENGRREAKLLGIITPWDVLKFSDQPWK